MAGTAELDAMTSPPSLPAPPQPNVSVQPENPLALPSLDPGVDSPYQPLDLPQDSSDLNRAAVLPPAEEPQNLGAVTHGGALAYMADKILRGAIQGHQAAVQHKEDQYNKKLAAQQAIYNDQARQYQELAKSGADPNSQEFLDAKNRVLTTWQAVMQTVGEKIPQPKPAKGSKGKSSQGQQQQQQGQPASGATSGSPTGPGVPPDPNMPQATQAHQRGANLLQRMFDQSKPDEALAAWYEGASKLGPPVFHATAPMLTPQYRARVQQQAQTGADEATATGTTAQIKARMAAQAQQIITLAGKPDRTPAEDAQLAQLRRNYQIAQDTLNPQKTPAGGNKRYGTNDKGVGETWEVDAEGNEIPGTRHPVSNSATASKGVPRFGKVGTQWQTWQEDANGKEIPHTRRPASSADMASPAFHSATTTSTHIDPATGLPYQTTNSTSSVTSHGQPTGGGAPATGTPPPSRHVTTGETAPTPATPGEPARAGLVGGGHITPKLQPWQSKQLSDAVADQIKNSKVLQLAVDSQREAAAGQDVSGTDAALIQDINRMLTQRFNKSEVDMLRNVGGLGVRMEGKVAQITAGQLGTAQRAALIHMLADRLKIAAGTTRDLKRQFGQASLPAPTPETHQWSVSAWQKANPKGDVEAAKKAAIAQHYQVVE